MMGITYLAPTEITQENGKPQQKFTDIDSVRLLIDLGADLDARSNDGRTALGIARGLVMRQYVHALVEGGYMRGI